MHAGETSSVRRGEAPLPRLPSTRGQTKSMSGGHFAIISLEIYYIYIYYNFTSKWPVPHQPTISLGVQVKFQSPQSDSILHLQQKLVAPRVHIYEVDSIPAA